MARLPRIAPLGIPQHIIQRGNNRQICFSDEQDMAYYAKLLDDYSCKFSVAIHAWVFMTNHVHLLLTPFTECAISNMMQSVGRCYVRFFNKKYRRSGTLWEGRFKSSLVESETYFLQCQRYIELNPVRAGMVTDPAEYAWSSYQCHALGKNIKICSPHDEYLRLGESDHLRQENYRYFIQEQLKDKLLTEIRLSVNRGLALGSERFKDEIERQCGRRVRPAIMGRPPQKSL